jgi:hypothetical protein
MKHHDKLKFSNEYMFPDKWPGTQGYVVPILRLVTYILLPSAFSNISWLI